MSNEDGRTKLESKVRELRPLVVYIAFPSTRACTMNALACVQSDAALMDAVQTDRILKTLVNIAKMQGAGGRYFLWESPPQHPLITEVFGTSGGLLWDFGHACAYADEETTLWPRRFASSFLRAVSDKCDGSRHHVKPVSGPSFNLEYIRKWPANLVDKAANAIRNIVC